jgi:RF-1 domain
MEINPNDLNVSTFNPNDRAGGWTLNKDVGVCVIHKPSGLQARASMDRSQHRNRATAMATLQKLVDDWDEAGRPALNLRLTKAEWDAESAQVNEAISVQIPNPHKIDLTMMRKNFSDGIINCKATLIQAFDYAIELEKRANGVKVVINEVCFKPKATWTCSFCGNASADGCIQSGCFACEQSEPTDDLKALPASGASQ